MNEPSPKSSTKERAVTYVYFGSLYFVTVGVLYLWGYWSTFNVNILEYLSLADVIKSTAYPIASAFVFFAVGAVFGEAMSDGAVLSPGAGRDTKVGKLLNRILPWLLLMYATATIALLLLGPVSKWNAFPILLALPAYFYVKKSGFLLSTLPHDSTRSITIFLLAVLPTFAYGQGRLKANAVVEGTRFEYVLSPIENVTVGSDATAAQRPRLIGHTGEFLFFLMPVNSTLAIQKFEGAKALVLKHFERPANLPVGSNPSFEPTASEVPASAAQLQR